MKQQNVFEFYIDDLTDEAKSRFIEFLGGENGNHDVIPFCIYETSYEEEDQDLLKLFKVTVTEKLQRVVTVEAESGEDAEQIVSSIWKNGGYILGADDFTGVEFEVIPVD